MSIGVFAAGGVIIDNAVSFDGALARDLVGGNAVHAAIGASHWLDRAGICARIPRNYPPSALIALEASGLDLGGLVIEQAEVTCSEWFFHRPDGSRADHLHASNEEADAFGMTGDRVEPELALRFEAHLKARHPGGGDFKAFRAGHPVTADQVPGRYWQARGVHLGPNRPDAQLTLAREARRLGLVVTCDPGFHAAGLSATQCDELLELVDAFLPSEAELEMLCPGRETDAALSWLSDRARAIVGVKRGRNGALIRPKDHGAALHIPVVPVTALDPTGAGDAFCGGFLAGLLLGDDALQAGLRGAVSASLAVETTGAIRPSERRRVAPDRLASLRLAVGQGDAARSPAPCPTRT
jgi:ribokinase